jgi:lipopolysaccharide exporter
LVLAGKQYQEYASLLQIVVLFSFFIPFSRQFGTMMDSAGLPKVNFLQLLFLAIVNVGLNYVLISAYGLMGAAYATLSTYSIGFILNQYLLYRYFDVSTMAVFQYMLKAYVKAPGVILQFFKRPKACISK